MASSPKRQYSELTEHSDENMLQHEPFFIAPELLHTILDHLRDDSRSLKSCSLVAQQWREPSRAHLFHQVSLTPDQLSEFVSIVRTAPEIGRAIRTLRIDNRLILVRYGRDVDVCQLYFLLRKTPAISALHFCGGRLRFVGHIAGPHTLGNITSLHATELDITSTEAALRFIAFVKLFQGINRVVISFERFRNTREMEDGYPWFQQLLDGSTTHIRQLSLDANAPQSIAAALDTYRSVSRVTCLDSVILAFSSLTSSVADATTIVEEMSPLLSKLVVHMNHSVARWCHMPREWIDPSVILNLSACPRLQELVLVIEVSGWYPGVDVAESLHDSFNTCATLLSVVPHTTTRVHFHIFVNTKPAPVTSEAADYLATSDWTSLRRVLAGVRQLQTAKFTVYDNDKPVEPRDIQVILVKVLPEASERGQIECTNEDNTPTTFPGPGSPH